MCTWTSPQPPIEANIPLKIFDLEALNLMFRFLQKFFVKLVMPMLFVWNLSHLINNLFIHSNLFIQIDHFFVQVLQIFSPIVKIVPEKPEMYIPNL